MILKAAMTSPSTASRQPWEFTVVRNREIIAKLSAYLEECGIAPMKERIASVDAALQLPAHLHSFALIPIGHPAEEKPQPDRYDPSGIHFID